MANFFDRKEQVMDIELTKHGKKAFSLGEFVPKFYSFHDDDVLYDSEFTPSGSIQKAYIPCCSDRTHPRARAQ